MEQYQLGSTTVYVKKPAKATPPLYMVGANLRANGGMMVQAMGSYNICLARITHKRPHLTLATFVKDEEMRWDHRYTLCTLDEAIDLLNEYKLYLAAELIHDEGFHVVSLSN